MVGWLAVPACAESAKRQILVLQSYNFSFPANSAAAEGFRSRLVARSPDHIEFDMEYLDLARSTSSESNERLAQFLSSRYSRRSLDVVIVVGGEALPFATEHRRDFAPGVPIVFLGTSKDSLAAAPAGPDVTGHIIDLDRNLKQTLALAEQLQPDARDLVFVAGSGVIDRRWQHIARGIVDGRDKKLNTTYLFELPRDELVSKLSQVPRNAIVVLLSMLRDGAGQQFLPSDNNKVLIGASSAPVYVPYPRVASYKGAIGGFSETFESMGETAADIALEILAGRSPGSIPPRSSSEARHWVDYDSMQRWNLREDRLPADTVVLFKPPPLAGISRPALVGTISFFALQSLLIAGLIVQRLRLESAQKENSRNQTALHHSHEQLRHLAGRLLNAEDKERKRIARELHDDVGQQIASLSIGLSTIKRLISPSQAPTLANLERLQKQAMTISEVMRDLSHDLHHGTLEHLGLPAALRERCEEMSRNEKVSIVLDVAGKWSEVADDIELCLYRIAQESLHNITKHAHAERVSIDLAQENGFVVMKIADDGIGFDPSQQTRLNGIGLLSMRERAIMLNGSFEMSSVPNKGTFTTVRIPVGGHHGEAANRAC